MCEEQQLLTCRGDIGSLFSHSTTPNVQFQMDHSTYTIYYKTSRQVAEGEELTIAVDVRKTESEGTTVVAEVDEAEADAIKEKERLKTEWENEIVPFDELGWSKVTSLVEPEDQLLTTSECPLCYPDWKKTDDGASQSSAGLSIFQPDTPSSPSSESC